jgi:hypothetical protein
MNTRTNMQQIVAAVEYTASGGEKKSYWTRIGVAFENRDGSQNLVFNFFPTDLETTTIQLRPFDNEDDRRKEETQPRRGSRRDEPRERR